MRRRVVIDKAKVRALREKRGESQEQFAVRIGVTRNTVARVENGLPVQRMTARGFAEALGVELDALLADEPSEASA